MLIGELAKETGLTSHTIRFYEKKGLLGTNHIRRGENNYRHYSEESIERITAIKTLHAAGFTLSQIKDLLDRWYTGTLTPHDGEIFLKRKMDEIDARMAELKRIKVSLVTKLGSHIKQAAQGRHPRVGHRGGDAPGRVDP